VPYIGPAVMVVVLFGVGLVTFPSLAHALIRKEEHKLPGRRREHPGAATHC
jgi:hypothetical protein